MCALVAWVNDHRDIHPVIVSAIAQFQLVHIHPFLDGNGRTSRLLSTLCLYRAGWSRFTSCVAPPSAQCTT